MTVQFSVTVRNAMLDAIETTVGASPKLRIYTGALPANCAAASTGTLLVEIACPADWMSNAAAGVKSLTAALAATAAVAAGTAGYYRMVDSTGATCHEQGTVTATGGGGDLTLDNVNLAVGQKVTISGKSYTAPNA